MRHAVFLAHSLRVQIADFGFAAIGAPMLCQSIVGSKTYMAPEVLGRRSNAAAHPASGYDGALVSPVGKSRRVVTLHSAGMCQANE